VVDAGETARSSNERITTSPPKFEISSAVPSSRNNLLTESPGCQAIDGEMEKNKMNGGRDPLVRRRGGRTRDEKPG
jgi:hypothetical protein